MIRCLRKVLLCLGLVSFAMGQQGFFTNPTGADGSVSYTTGQRVDISWEGTEKYSILSLGFYSEADPTISWLISNSLDFPINYTWTVATNGFNLQASALFRLYICNGTNFGNPFQSSLFAIRDQSSTSSATTTSAASTSSVTAGSTVTFLVSVPVASSSASSSATPSPIGGASSGLNTGAKAGIGVGVALGVIAILAGLFLLQRWHKRKSQSTPPSAPPESKQLSGFKQPHTTLLVHPSAELDGAYTQKPAYLH